MRWILIVLIFISCKEKEVNPEFCMAIKISDANPIQFWLNGVPSYNTKSEAGIDHVCFYQPWNLEDEIKIQVSDSNLLKRYSLLILNSEDIILHSLPFLFEDGVHTVTFIGDDLSISGKVKFKITENGTLTTPQVGSITDRIWSANAFGNGVFVAVCQTGTGNRAATSTDGLTWTLRTTPQDNIWSGIAFGNGVFVAVATDGTNRVMTSPDGITWTVRSITASAWYHVAYGNGRFVAVSLDGRIAYSTDNGVNWTLATAPTFPWYSVAYGDGIWVAVDGNSGNIVRSTDNGLNWTTVFGNIAWDFRTVAYGAGYFVTFGLKSSVGTGLRSTDGVTWTEFSVINNRQFRSVTFGNGLFVAVTNVIGAGEFYQYSSDAISWTELSNLNDRQWQSICFGIDRFSVVGLDLFVTNKASTIPITLAIDVAYSDLVDFQDLHCDTRLIEYSNGIDYAGLVYTGLESVPTFGIRIKSKFYEERWPEENESEPDGAGNVDKLTSTVKTQRNLETDVMPPYMHKKLKLILQHNSLYIDNRAWVKEESYEVNKIDDDYPFFTGSVFLTQKDDEYYLNLP